MEEHYLSLAEAANALDISERTAYRWINSGKLRAYKPGRDYRIPQSAVIATVRESEVSPKADRSSLEPSLFNGLDDERREPRLPEVADELLILAHRLLLTWEAELPDKAQVDDDEWLANITVTWHLFGKIHYGVLEDLGVEGLRDKEKWLALYMDVNAAIHRINAAIRAHSAAGSSPAAQATVTLDPLPGAA